MNVKHIVSIDVNRKRENWMVIVVQCTRWNVFAIILAFCNKITIRLRLKHCHIKMMLLGTWHHFFKHNLGEMNIICIMVIICGVSKHP